MKKIKIYTQSIRNLTIASALCGLVSIPFTSCTPVQKPITKHDDLILINQNGYQTTSPKIALIRKETKQNVSIVDSLGNQVLSVKAGEPKEWKMSGDKAAIVDFSQLTQPGKYYLVVNDTIVSHPVIISANPYNKIGEEAIRAFYYNRTAMPIDEKHGGKWARPAGHPDTVVYVHPSAASKQRPAGTVLSSPGGWYDAGDYNKYVVNSGISTYTLLKTLEDFTPFISAQQLNIPESDNKLPDLLDETLYNLRWVMTMQDPNDGGVYHKLTEKQFSGFIMPHECKDERVVVQKTTAAALNYAALLAKTARVIKPWSEQLPGLADSCRTLAINAWNWAVKNPTIVYIQPEDIKTGAYDDNLLKDEFYWAACELYLTTADKQFIPHIIQNYKSWGIPTWGNPGTLGTLSLLKESTAISTELSQLPIKQDFITMVDSLLNNEQNAAYHVSINSFDWGSNSDVVNQGMVKLVAYQITGEAKYLNSAINDADYILGRNATGYCFVTGAGSKQVMNIHHRPSAADGITEPVPGFLAGGPNTIVLNDCGDKVVRDTFPAKSYVDAECSYSTNEIAINWNAPLAYLFNGLAANLK